MQASPDAAFRQEHCKAMRTILALVMAFLLTGAIASRTLVVSPTSSSLVYKLTVTNGAPVQWVVSGVPSWLTTPATRGSTPYTLTLTPVPGLKPGLYSATLRFTNLTNGRGNTVRVVSIIAACGYLTDDVGGRLTDGFGGYLLEC